MASQVFLHLPVKVFDKECTLRNGKKLNKISLGVSHLEDYETVYDAVDIALQTGYRAFDCTPLFSMEKYLGNALQELLPKYNLKRKDITISTKLLPKDYGTDSTSEAIWRSCKNLKTRYLDFVLMQWPGGENLDLDDKENQRLREDTWDEIVKMRRRGVLRSQGVCNFTPKHLENIRNHSGLMPVINQVEFHPKFPQVELRQYCDANNIVLQAISFKETFHPLVLNERVVKEIARHLNKTPTQILLKWCINKGVAVIPQSKKAKTIKQNFQLFDFVLEKPEMDCLNSISDREKYLKNPLCVI